MEGTRYCSSKLRLTPAGRVTLTLFLLGSLLGWTAGGVAMLFNAFGAAVWILALLASYRQTRGIELRVLPGPAHWAGETFGFEVVMHLPHSGLGFSSGARRNLVISRTPERGRVGLDRPIGSAEALTPGTPTTVICEYRHQMRGRETQLALTLDSCHPFGLLHCTRSYKLTVDMLAWPRLGLWRAPSERRVDREPTQRTGVRRRGNEEFRLLAPWRPGMNMHDIHWKHSARRGMWLVQEKEGEATGPVEIELITSVRGSSEGGARNRSFETAVSLTATLVDFHLRKGTPVHLRLSSTPDKVFQLQGRVGRVSALDLLADVQAQHASSNELKELVHSARARRPRQVVLAGGSGLGDLSEPSSVQVLDVDAADIDLVFRRVQEQADNSPTAQELKGHRRTTG
ncbi:MAG: DUF58 domain-containing protein [bacterium]|nr:DUF58 domain-containing protein [bacterium]